MEKLIFGLTVALIGMFVVFVGLVILIGFIKLIALAGKEKKAKPVEQPDVLPTPQIAVPQPVMAQGVTPEVLAAITAAIAAVWQGDTGFVVRHVRRVHNAPAWNLAGRDDQVYSRM